MMGASVGAAGGTVNQNLTANTQQAANPYIEGAGGTTGLMSNQPMGVSA
jgi:hypothetical protein